MQFYLFYFICMIKGIHALFFYETHLSVASPFSSLCDWEDEG